MQKQYRRLLQALLLAACLVVSMRAALYAAEEEETTSEPGLVIVAVDPAGPAAQAGVVRGDILLAVNDVKVNTVADLLAALGKVEAGATVTLQLQHGDAAVEYEVTTAEQQQRAYLGIRPYGAADLLLPALDQFALPAEPDLVLPPHHFGFSPWANTAMGQLVVVDVLADSAAAEAGIQVNDVIMAFNDATELTLPALQEELATLAPGDVVTLTVARADAEPAAVVVTLGEGPDGRAQIGVQLGVVSLFDASEGMGQPPAFMPMPPMMGKRFHFWQERPGGEERRFFHFGRPSVPPMYFFVMPYPGWAPPDFLMHEEGFAMPTPAQPGQWFAAPPVSVEIQREIQQGAPVEQAPAALY